MSVDLWWQIPLVIVAVPLLLLAYAYADNGAFGFDRGRYKGYKTYNSTYRSAFGTTRCRTRTSVAASRSPTAIEPTQRWERCRPAQETGMTAINKELYDALVAAGAPEDKASAAAATVKPAEELATRADIALLKAEISSLETRIFRAMTAQTLLLIAAMVGLKLFG